MRQRARPLPGILSCGLLCAMHGVAAGQAVPSLGSEFVIGTAGVMSVDASDPLGASPNPALDGTHARWMAGFTAVMAPSTDESERTLSVAGRLGVLGIGATFTHRSVDDLFEDPALAQSSLAVKDTELELGLAVPLLAGVRVGAGALYTSGTVLGLYASGFGAKVGAHLDTRVGALGLMYGVAEPSLRWGSSAGRGTTSVGTRLLAVAALAPLDHWVTGLPRLAVEYSLTDGDGAAQWVRSTLGWHFIGGSLDVLVGSAVDISESRLPTMYEAGVSAEVSPFRVMLGSRFSTAAIPGTALVLGARVAGP